MKKRGAQIESGINRTQRDCALVFKRAVVDLVEKGELSYKQAQEHCGIQGRSTVLVWLRKHGRQNWGPIASYGCMSAPTRTSASSQGQATERLIKELEVQLKEAREKSQFFDLSLTF